MSPTTPVSYVVIFVLSVEPWSSSDCFLPSQFASLRVTVVHSWTWFGQDFVKGDLEGNVLYFFFVYRKNRFQ